MAGRRSSFPAASPCDAGFAGRGRLDGKPGLAHRQQQWQVEFLRLQLGDPAAARRHDRGVPAEVFHAHAATGPLFDLQLVPRYGQIAENLTTLDLALRSSAEFQGAGSVLQLLLLNGILDIETKRHCRLLCSTCCYELQRHCIV